MKKRREDESCQTSSGSYEWGREAINAGKFVISKKQAKKVKTPVLLFQAGKDTLVTPGAQKEFIKRISDGQLVIVPDIRHEIYRAPNSVLQPYLEMILNFMTVGKKSCKKGGSAEVLLSCRRYESKTCCVLTAGVV